MAEIINLVDFAGKFKLKTLFKESPYRYGRTVLNGKLFFMADKKVVSLDNKT